VYKKALAGAAAALALLVGWIAPSAASAAEAPHTNAVPGCRFITIRFAGFPNLPDNTVREKVRIDGTPEAVLRTFVFNGPRAVDEVPVPLGPGHHTLDVFTIWTTNGVAGNHDQPINGGVTCAPLTIHAPADRANVISGEETLVWLDLPGRVSLSALKVSLDGSDVSSQFAERPNGKVEALLTGLTPGSNEVAAEAPGETTAHYTIVDHPIGGPATSGPQVQPWRCKNAHPTDAQCDEAPTYTYEYKNVASGEFEAYDPSKPPEAALIASTTTENGTTEPFIIRTETGYQDRDQYKIAVLFQPGKSWDAWAPQPQFAHKLLITHGEQCGTDHQSGTAPSVTNTLALGLGFAVMSTALDNAVHNCNIATEAESLIMAKEHLIDHYGTLRFTIGEGSSGGALVMQQVANAYPGVYQGIVPSFSFQDAVSNGSEIVDDHLTLKYFENPAEWGTGIAWTPVQIGEVQGHPNPGNAVVNNVAFFELLADPAKTCAGVEAAEAYNPGTNPSGVRCDLFDYMINVFGPRPESSWGPVETKLGHGFAGRPIGNVGEQYGVKPLLDKTITPAQFVDINSKIGGVGIDAEPTKARMVADQPALRNSYRSGAVNETNNLKSVAIIDARGPDPGAVHAAYRSWSVRARLEREERHFPKNDVIWFGPVYGDGSPAYLTEGVEAIDHWLNVVEADSGKGRTLEEKIAADRPENVHDRCTPQEQAEEVVVKVEVPGVGVVCQSPAVETKFATPRVVAGEAISTDNMECQLTPLEKSAYPGIEFTEEEWKTLEKTFPNGVCDFSKAGVGQQKTIPWQTYQNDSAGGTVIHGGKALRAAPTNSGEGWTSSTFAGWLK
jgi:hypothetical protein